MATDSEALRAEIAGLLADGLQTQREPLPRDHIEFDELVGELQSLPADDLRQRLVVAGFQDRPHGEEECCCSQCMYYLSNRRWCDLPGLDLPVDAHWWCRLWRI